jgi:hypothetical protein
MAQDAKILDGLGQGKKAQEQPKSTTPKTGIPPGIDKLTDKMIGQAVPEVIEVFHMKLLAQVRDPNSPLIKGINDKIAEVYEDGMFGDLVLAGMANFLPETLPESKQLP